MNNARWIASKPQQVTLRHYIFVSQSVGSYRFSLQPWKLTEGFWNVLMIGDSLSGKTSDP